MLDIFANFTSSTEETFPKDLCTLQSKEGCVHVRFLV